MSLNLFNLYSLNSNYLIFNSINFYIFTILFSYIFFNYISYKGVFILTTISLFFLNLSLLHYFLNLYNKIIFIELNLFKNNLITNNYLVYIFKINTINFNFLLLVSFIGFFNNFYLITYFKFEPEKGKFILLINFFIISMVLLIIANSVSSIILGWELIGISSFFLINFWHLKINTIKCALKAYSFNKCSDFFLYFFFIFFLYFFNSGNIDMVVLLNLKNKNINIMLIFLLIASSFKTTQVFLHIWLPDSMEAPVPASALIHSATLITAGIFLLIKFNFLFLNNKYIIYIIYFWGFLTAIYGSVVASFQTDIKKLLAYSTISHCGFMYVCFVTFNLNLVLFYIIVHGLFKALTFMIAGYFIKILNTQDIRKMGQLISISYLEGILFLISTFNLGCLPFTFGWYFKHFFLYNILNKFFLFNFLLLISLLFSLIYSLRLIKYTLFDTIKYNKFFLIKKNYLNKYQNRNNILMKTIFFLFYLFSILYFYIIIFKQYHNSFHTNLYYINLIPLNETKILNLNYSYYYYINFLIIILIYFFFFNNKILNFKYLSVKYLTDCILFIFFFNFFLIFF